MINVAMATNWGPCGKGLEDWFQIVGWDRASVWVVAKGDPREIGDRELELFQICQSTSLPGLSVNFFR